jgi:hypothetical protein
MHFRGPSTLSFAIFLVVMVSFSVGGCASSIRVADPHAELSDPGNLPTRQPAAMNALDEASPDDPQYLEILQQRFETRLDVQMRIEPDVLGAEVPALILQPVVENVMKHGADARDGNIRMEIDAWRSDDVLTFAVRDGGAGVDAAGAGGGQGYGLRHTRQRLRTHYGDRQSFILRNRDGGGTEAIIQLPFRITSARDGVVDAVAPPFSASVVDTRS